MIVRGVRLKSSAIKLWAEFTRELLTVGRSGLNSRGFAANFRSFRAGTSWLFSGQLLVRLGSEQLWTQREEILDKVGQNSINSFDAIEKSNRLILQSN